MLGINIIWTDGCMEKLIFSEWLNKYRKRTCKFVCFSRSVENYEKEYRVSFFPVVHNLHHLEIADRGVCESDWAVEGGGIIFIDTMKRCGKDFATWGCALSLYDSKYQVCPSNKAEADTILKAIENFCVQP